MVKLSLEHAAGLCLAAEEMRERQGSKAASPLPKELTTSKWNRCVIH